MIFVDATEGAAHAARTAAALAREQGLRLEGEAWAHGVRFFGVGEGGGRTLLVWLGLGPGVPESERRARRLAVVCNTVRRAREVFGRPGRDGPRRSW